MPISDGKYVCKIIADDYFIQASSGLTHTGSRLWKTDKAKASEGQTCPLTEGDRSFEFDEVEHTLRFALLKAQMFGKDKPYGLGEYDLR
eukprot:gene27055-33286_t